MGCIWNVGRVVLRVEWEVKEGDNLDGEREREREKEKERASKAKQSKAKLTSKKKKVRHRSTRNPSEDSQRPRNVGLHHIFRRRNDRESK